MIIMTLNLLHKPMLYILCNAHQKKERIVCIFPFNWARSVLLCTQYPHLIRRVLGKVKIKLPVKNYEHFKKCGVPKDPRGVKQG